MCSDTPRFSFRVPKPCVTAVCVRRAGCARAVVYGRVWYWVYLGGVYRVGNTGYPARAHRLLEEQAHDSGAGPGSLLQGGWSGWSWVQRTYGGRDGHSPPLRGPVGTLRAPPWECPQNAHLGPIWRHFTSFLIKLVKTLKCHQNMSKRPP